MLGVLCRGSVMIVIIPVLKNIVVKLVLPCKVQCS